MRVHSIDNILFVSVSIISSSPLGVCKSFVFVFGLFELVVIDLLILAKEENLQIWMVDGWFSLLGIEGHWQRKLRGWS